VNGAIRHQVRSSAMYRSCEPHQLGQPLAFNHRSGCQPGEDPREEEVRKPCQVMGERQSDSNEETNLAGSGMNREEEGTSVQCVVHTRSRLKRQLSISLEHDCGDNSELPRRRGWFHM